MLPERVSNPGPLSYKSGALPIALRGPKPQSNYTYAYTYSNYRILRSSLNDAIVAVVKKKNP